MYYHPLRFRNSAVHLESVFVGIIHFSEQDIITFLNGTNQLYSVFCVRRNGFHYHLLRIITYSVLLFRFILFHPFVFHSVPFCSILVGTTFLCYKGELTKLHFSPTEVQLLNLTATLGV